MYICIYTYACMYTCACMYIIFEHIYMYVYVQCMLTHVCVYVYVYIRARSNSQVSKSGGHRMRTFGSKRVLRARGACSERSKPCERSEACSERSD